MRPSARTIGAAALLAGVTCAWVGCAQIFGIDEANAVPDPIDAATLGDATQATDATNGLDGSDAGRDGGGESDAPAETCASRLAQILTSPITPAIWGGLDFSVGGMFTDLPSSGGLTMAQTGLIPCADFAEQVPTGAMPINPGYRTYGFGIPDGGATALYPFELQANAQSQVIDFVLLQHGYTGTLTFSSRTGGSYGSHTYEIAIGALSVDGGAVDAGVGSVKRDGVNFAADWSFGQNDAGALTASEWANELYDALMATFSPTTPAISDCLSIPSAEYQGVLVTHEVSSCLYVPNDGTGRSALGIRPIKLYFYFNAGTNQTTLVYYFWLGGTTTCNTPVANAERMDYAPVGLESIGGLYLTEQVSNATGLTYEEANAVECTPPGMSVTPPDPGFGGYQWGQNGEVEAEYVLDSGLIHALYAKPGYVGSLLITDSTRANNYLFTIGNSATDNDAGFTIDWPASGTPMAATTLSNAYCGVTDTDCVAAGDCTVSYDGSGNMMLGFTCNGPVPLNGIVFTHETSTPQQFFATNPNVP